MTNLETYAEAQRGMTPNERMIMDNFFIGFIAPIMSKLKWDEAIEKAQGYAKRSNP